jgi:hypothetical protein
MTIQLSSPQMGTVLQALADAAAYRRALVAAWCERCETTPEGSCPEHLADLAAAQTYDALARELTSAPAAGELMTRREVAYLFSVTSATVAQWARSGKLAEIRGEDGRPRYRRPEVEALHRSRFGGRPR